MTKPKQEKEMNQSHTMGPWVTDGQGGYERQRSDGSPWRSQCVGTADGRTVAEVCIPKGGGWKHPEALANARLIASAPELLEALEELRAQLREHVKFDVKRHYSLMVADAAAGTAIAKARGE